MIWDGVAFGRAVPASDACEWTRDVDFAHGFAAAFASLDLYLVRLEIVADKSHVGGTARCETTAYAGPLGGLE